MYDREGRESLEGKAGMANEENRSVMIQSSNVNYGLEESFGLRNPCNSYYREQALQVHNSAVCLPLRPTSGLNRNFKIIQVGIICPNRWIVYWIVQGILADCFECSARDNPIGF